MPDFDQQMILAFSSQSEFDVRVPEQDPDTGNFQIQIKSESEPIEVESYTVTSILYDTVLDR